MFRACLPLITFLILCPSACTAADPGPPATLDVLEGYREAVVTVRAQTFQASPETQAGAAIDPSTGRIAILSNRKVALQERTGAGVIIDPHGTIVTNTHVIFGSQRILVVLKDGTRAAARVLYVSPDHDFSFLKIDPPRTLTTVEWADSDRVALGDEITTIGHSPLLNETLSGGRIVGLGTRDSSHGPTAELIEINVNHYEGDSGGPVFDRQGRLVGLMNAKRLSVQKACLAIPANKIHFAYINLVNPPEKQ